MSSTPEWLTPATLEEALAIKAERGEDATVVAGGTFLAILVGQGLLEPSCFLSLDGVAVLDGISVDDEGALRLGATVRHRDVERSAVVAEGWPALRYAFSLVASPRIRNRATVGGVLADADYASDPPAILSALGARVEIQGARGSRELAVEELITGYYETALAPDELITDVVVPRADGPSVYRKFRSRTHEDRPCVSVAAARLGDTLRVVVGAVAAVPQLFPPLCSGEPAEIAAAYADAIDPISDVRGSAAYRKRVVAVEVRRALEELGEPRS